MDLVLGVSLLIGAALVGNGLLRRSSRGPVLQIGLGMTMLVATGLFVVAALRLPAAPLPEAAVAHRPIEVSSPGYVGSDNCWACHPDAYATWEASYHRSMTQVAAPDRVLGDFDDRELQLGDHTFRLSRSGDELFVDMPDLDPDTGRLRATRVRRKIALTTGSHHMQAYWYASGNSRVLGMLPFVHHVESGDWIPRNAAFLMPPDDRPDLELGRWNKVCLECHVVQGRLRPFENASGGGQDTHVTEFGVACEACHGPGEAHVESAGGVLTRLASRFSDRPREDIVQPARLSHERSSEVCGQCHSTSVWTRQEAIDAFMEDGFAYRPGDVLAATKAVIRGTFDRNPPEVQAVLRRQPRLLPSTFWSDGMNRIAGREYNGLVESPCFLRGELSCSSCHRMHKSPDDRRTPQAWANDQLGERMRENTACVQCHVELNGREALEAHSHHAESSPGAQCYNCHMPYTAYGLLTAVRSHQIDSPSVQVGLETGRPVACNQCHVDRTEAWTAERLADWYGIAPPPRTGSTSQTMASLPRMALEGDAGQRALAAWSLGWDAAREAAGEDWQPLYLAVLLADPYPAVRRIAFRSLRSFRGFENFEYDPLDSTERLQQRAFEAARLWTTTHGPFPGRERAELLIGPDGPRLDRLRARLRARDDRAVTFAE